MKFANSFFEPPMFVVFPNLSFPTLKLGIANPFRPKQAKGVWWIVIVCLVLRAIGSSSGC